MFTLAERGIRFGGDAQRHGGDEETARRGDRDVSREGSLVHRKSGASRYAQSTDERAGIDDSAVETKAEDGTK